MLGGKGGRCVGVGRRCSRCEQPDLVILVREMCRGECRSVCLALLD